MSAKPKRLRHALVTGAIVTGTGLGAAGLASAASTATTSTGGSSSSSTSGSSAVAAPPVGSASSAPVGVGGDPATLAHGPDETLLTGTDLQKATAAATGAVPGATIVRAETNSSGDSPYEVHMKKADGTYVTVELDSNFGVTSTISGFGAGPAGAAAQSGATSPSTSTN